mmetsp:Transcript_34402/g.86735  ORF Transcript_34402/g.86735 Transcript_34402/m.86735 type:complete len:271 (-) Transcript_34402:4582-5394(-)
MLICVARKPSTRSVSRVAACPAGIHASPSRLSSNASVASQVRIRATAASPDRFSQAVRARSCCCKAATPALALGCRVCSSDAEMYRSTSALAAAEVFAHPAIPSIACHSCPAAIRIRRSSAPRRERSAKPAASHACRRSGSAAARAPGGGQSAASAVFTRPPIASALSQLHSSRARRISSVVRHSAQVGPHSLRQMRSAAPACAEHCATSAPTACHSAPPSPDVTAAPSPSPLGVSLRAPWLAVPIMDSSSMKASATSAASSPAMATESS